ncbi:MAG: DUF1361 domain-containing protein [Chitinophagales bacterium]|nr:DUF1361 domain-containing protein [Chitinophagales bacterium]
MRELWLRIPQYIRVTLILTVVNIAILAVRNIIVGCSVFDFLKSNLFIGSLPALVIAVFLKEYKGNINAFFFWFITLIWVLFYPNAPYMISDLIHVNADNHDETYAELIVFDTLIIFSIAMLSVYYGFLSLKIMFNIFKDRYSNAFAHTAIAVTILLSCLGFYMGREMLSAIKLGNGYLYSWEIFLEPRQIITAVWDLLFPIGAHKEAYMMMLLFGIVQYLLLIMFKDISNVESSGFVTNTATSKNQSE